MFMAATALTYARGYTPDSLERGRRYSERQPRLARSRWAREGRTERGRSRLSRMSGRHREASHAS
jgi:hypothetical protein